MKDMHIYDRTNGSCVRTNIRARKGTVSIRYCTAGSREEESVTTAYSLRQHTGLVIHCSSYTVQ